jgi:tetratricopeptide (TPR) repeat protein
VDILKKAVSYLEKDKPELVIRLLKNKNSDLPELDFYKGEAYRRIGDFNKAISSYKSGMKKSFPCSVELFDNMLGLASCLRTLGKTKEALSLFSDINKIASFSNSKEIKFQSALEYALVLRADGQLKKSLKELFSIEKQYKSDKSALGFVCWAKGGIFRLLGQFKKSLAEFEKSAHIAKKQHDNCALGYAYFGYAGVSRIAGDIEGSKKYYQLASKYFKNTPDIFGKAYAHCGYANALRQNGELKLAYENYKKADKLYSQINDDVDLGYVKWGIGKILQSWGKFRESNVQFKLALRLFSDYSEARGEILSLIAISQNEYMLENRDRAIKLFDKAVARAKKEGLATHLEIFT